MSFKDLDNKAKIIAADYKRCERELVAIIARIDQAEAFYKFGHSSLFSYMTKQLGLSEAIACNISAVVRKSYEVPELQHHVTSGELSLSKARKLTPVITKDNHKTWLDVAKHKNQRQVEREVSLAQPKAAIAERVNYVSPRDPVKEKVQVKHTIPRIKLQLGVSEKLMIQLRRCQDLESQRSKRPINLEQSLEALVDFYLNKKDPLKKAQRQKMRGKLNAEASVSDRSTARTSEIAKEEKAPSKVATPRGLKDNAKNSRKPIPAKIKHQVQLRDQGRCTHVDQHGVRCSSRRHLEIHHISPVCAGGGNELENLRLLCHGHHKIQHLEK